MPDEIFRDDVCHCIECTVKADLAYDKASPMEDTPQPYDYIPTEEEELEIEANFLDDAGVGRM